MKLGKILLVDDVTAIREVIKFYFEAIAECQFIEASSGQEAIALLRENPDLQMIFSDYYMHPGNGAELCKEVRKTSQIPFFLHSSDRFETLTEFNDVKNFFYVEKPMTLESLQPLLLRAFPKLALTETSQRQYISVGLSLLSAMHFAPVDLYLKLSQDKYVRQFHGGSEILHEDLTRLRAKELTHLFILSKDLERFSDQFQNFADKIEKAQESGQSLEQITATTADLINSVQSQLGVTPEVQRLTEKNIEIVLQMADRSPDLRELSEKFSKIEGTPYSQHCILTALIATSIGKNLNWISNQTSIKFAFAAMVHDSSLGIDQWEQEAHSDSDSSVKPFTIPSSGGKSFAHHGSLAADLVRKWPACPPDVDVIVTQHHEKPDGTGFPSHLTFQRITPLSMIFIVAHHLAVDMVATKGHVQVQDWIIKNETLYSHGDFKKVLHHLLPGSKS